MTKERPSRQKNGYPAGRGWPFWGYWADVGPLNRSSGRTEGVTRPEAPAGQYQVGQAEQREQLRLVLGQPPVTRLAVLEQVLDDVKRMLDFGPQARLDLFDPFLQAAQRVVGQGPAHARAQRHVPGDRRVLILGALGHALVAGIAQRDRFLPVQQAVRLGHVVDVGRRGQHRVHQPRVQVDADVRLHAEVPLVAFLGLMHVRIARPVAVLGRRRGGDQRRVHERALAQQQALARQVIADGLEDHPAQTLRLEQAAELQQRGGIRRRLAGQVDADEAADGVAVVHGVLDALVRQPEALLRHVHAQHARQPQRRPAGALAGRVERRQRRLQLRPRRHRLQLRQEALAARLLLLAGVLEVGKARLHDVCSPPLRTSPHCLRSKVSRHQQVGINQRFPRREIRCLIAITPS